MKNLFIPIATAALWTAFGSSARADCGLGVHRQATLPRLLQPQELRSPEPSAALPQGTDATEASVAGLWDVIFVSGGQLYDEAFDQYHSDGTEIMNDIVPPSGGNVCLGVWAKTGPWSYKLRHPFWIFDTNGSLTGRGVLLEQFTLDAHQNSYAGVFTFQFRDLNGDTIPSMPDVSGTLQATRITVE